MFNAGATTNVEGEEVVDVDRLAWFKFIDTMAGSDLTTHEEFFKVNWLYATTILAARIEKEKKKNEK